MGDVVAMIGFIYLPTLVLCGAAIWWSTKTRHRGIKRVMRFSALFWAVFLAAIISFAIAVEGSCQGNALYGYSHCTIFPNSLSNYNLALIVMSIASGVFYAGLLFSICALLEYRWRNAPR